MSNSNDYLTVSELSELFGITVQTLHYYDRIDLFKPDARDRWTSYRKYRFDQIYQLACIRYLRKIGYSIDEVRKFLASRKPEATLALLRERSLSLQEEWKKLFRINDAILRKIQFIEQKRSGLKLDAIVIQHFPERLYIPIGSEEHLYMDDSFYFFPTVVFYEGTQKSFGAYINTSSADSDKSLETVSAVSVIPAGDYIVGYYKGSYDHIQERFVQLRSAFPDFRLSPVTVNFNIIDQFVERLSDNYITEIQVQILTGNS
jgi:DNA-binding transcriptional MerR regulator